MLVITLISYAKFLKDIQVEAIYYGVYDQALRGINDFHITDLRWFKDPRYTKDLRWVKCQDICHYMLNREQYNDDECVLHDFDLK